MRLGAPSTKGSVPARNGSEVIAKKHATNAEVRNKRHIFPMSLNFKAKVMFILNQIFCCFRSVQVPGFELESHDCRN